MLHLKRGERVGAEAEALAAARHPGVVELVGLADGVLQTRLLDGRSLAELGPLTADEVAGVAAAVGTTLADLHELGVVHGGVEAGHVLVCADGRLVLCSLGRGGDPPDDVAALGRLVADLLSAQPGDARSPAGGAPWRRPRSGPGAGIGTRARSRLRRVGAGPAPSAPRLRRRSGRARPGRLGAMLAPPAAPALAALAAEATAAEPSRRPTARAFATAVHQRVPTARLPALPARPLLPLPPPPPGPVRRRWPRSPARGAARPLLAVVAGTAAMAALVSWVGADPGGGASPSKAPPVLPRPVATDPTDSTTTTAATAHPAPSAPTSTSTTDPVATRVWPPEPLQFSDGVLTVEGARYALGQPGDVLVAGDWTCQGRRTLALLRPATGEVFAFDGWASPGEEVAARPVGRVAGGVAVRAVDVDGDGCHDLEVERPGQPPVHVEARS